jgi:hypothetical protein
MKITLILEGYYLKNKYPSSTIELDYFKPITIRKVLKDAKISPTDVFFIKVGDSIVKVDYILAKSEEVKLFPVSVGG